MKTPLKETSIVPNDFCRICKIDFKTSGRSKINVFVKNNKEFLKTLSSVLSSDVIQQNMMGVSKIICQKCQREVLQFSSVLEQLEKLWEKCNKALRIIGRVPLAQEMTEVLHERFSGCCVSTALSERLKPFRRKQK